MEKLQRRIEKQTKQRDQLSENVSLLERETEELEYANAQYKEQLEKVKRETDEVDASIAQSSVKANEVAVVTALIEEKSRLADEKKQLKRNCIDEKKNLDE